MAPTRSVFLLTAFVASALLTSAAGVDVNLGTAGNAANWKITGAGAVAATAFQTNLNRTGAISLTSTGVGTGTFISGGTLGAFNGFWYADCAFTLPPNASGISLTFSGLYGNDRAVLLLNDTIIGDADHLGATGTGVMAFPPGPPDISYVITGTTAGTITAGFRPGANRLRLVVNNTGVVPITAPTATFASPSGDGTTAFLAATLTYNTTGVPSFPPPSLRNVVLLPAFQDGACRFSGTVVNGPVLGIARVEASLDLGRTDPWTVIASSSLDTTGSAVFANLLDARPTSRDARALFFRIITDTGP